MGQNRAYEIAFVGLIPGIHVYEYKIEDKFFAEFGAQDFSNCDANVKLTLDKNQGFMQLHFDISGSVESYCDRCGNPLIIQLWDEFNLIVKLVENPDAMNAQEEDSDIFYIDRNESHISVASWIFEFIILSIPLQKECELDEKGNSLCNKTALDTLEKLKTAPIEINDRKIWKGLEQFKNLSEEQDSKTENKKNKKNKL
jgi:uncharacterized metal-binding protein YceD (DUF177 family)